MKMKTAYSAVLAGAFAASIVSAASWTSFRANMQRTGCVESLIDKPDSVARWVQRLGSGIVSSPAVNNGILYVGARDNCLYALNTASGKIVWKSNTGGWIESSPSVVGGRVIAASMDGFIYVFDAANGKTLTTYTAGAQVSSPAVLNDGSIVTTNAYPETGSGGLYRYGPMPIGITHQIQPRWNVEFGQISHSSPAVCGALAVAAAGNGVLYCVNMKNQKTAWTLQTTGDVNLSSPAVGGNTVYFAPGDGGVYAVDLQSGAIRWKYSDKESLAKCANGMRWIDSYSFRKLLIVSPARRSVLIQQMAEEGIAVPPLFDDRGLAKASSSLSISDFYTYGTIHSSSVAVGADAVYVTMKETGYPSPEFTLRAIDRRNGSELWRFVELRNCDPSWYCSSPLATGNMVFAGWGEGQLYGFDAKTGEMRWHAQLSGDILSSPVLADGALYAATLDGSVYAFNVKERPFNQISNRPLLIGSNAAGMRLQFGLNEPGHVRIQLFSTNGRLVETVVDEIMIQGSHTVAVSGTRKAGIQLAAGAYLIRAAINGNTYMLRMLLAR